MKRGRRWDLTSVLGVPIGVGFILLGQVLEGGSLQSILQLTAAVIVFGGTFGATLVSFSMKDVQRAVGSLREVFFDDEPPVEDTIGLITRMAHRARRDGIMSLEDDVERVQDPFLRRGLGLAVDGTNPNTLRAMLDAESVSRDDIDELPARVYEAAGGEVKTAIVMASCGLGAEASRERLRAAAGHVRRALEGQSTTDEGGANHFQK